MVRFCAGRGTISAAMLAIMGSRSNKTMGVECIAVYLGVAMDPHFRKPKI